MFFSIMLMQQCPSRRSILLFATVSIIASISMVIFINFLNIFLEWPSLLRHWVHSSEIAGLSKLPGLNSNAKSIFIPGAGFSGFFYTLGRLHFATSIQQMNDTPHEYYCFSAGCLALVASLMELPLNDAIELAHTSRNRWMNGEIGRYDVVEHFVDGLLFSNYVNGHVPKAFFGKGSGEYISRQYNTTDDSINSEEASACIQEQSGIIRKKTCEATQENASSSPVKHKIVHKLPMINIITSEWNRQSLLSHSILKPTSISHLREKLVQTTWM